MRNGCQIASFLRGKSHRSYLRDPLLKRVFPGILACARTRTTQCLCGFLNNLPCFFVIFGAGDRVKDCSVCAELEEEPLMANTTLICGNCADSLMAEQILSGDLRKPPLTCTRPRNRDCSLLWCASRLTPL
jgi:hypothetical protein